MAAPNGQDSAVQRVVAPLSGPTPACSGTSAAVLQPGVAGLPGQPALAAPPSWAALRLSLAGGAGSTVESLTGLRVVISNVGDAPVALEPCPTFGGAVSGSVPAGVHGAAGVAVMGWGGPLGCDGAPVVIAAGSSVGVPLPDRHDLADAGFVTGSTVQVVAIASVPTATTTVTLQ